MDARRSTEGLDTADGKTRMLYELGLGCRVIAAVLDERHDTIYRRVSSMGITRDRKQGCRTLIPAKTSSPFNTTPVDHTKDRSAAAVARAMAYFLERGHQVSTPANLGFCPYDLLVETDDGIKKIQVKYTGQQEPESGFVVKVHRCDGRENIKASYLACDVDYFYILTSEFDNYLIPLAAIGDRLTLNLNAWEEYRAE